jgi:hypothetical protein
MVRGIMQGPIPLTVSSVDRIVDILTEFVRDDFRVKPPNCPLQSKSISARFEITGDGIRFSCVYEARRISYMIPFSTTDRPVTVEFSRQQRSVVFSQGKTTLVILY